mmetsp:Transcript_27565/g.60675  ORF Transcript_27565/g.60675 Transcript_27565/m.60675 type:complete len:398 (+) Transcript_27565:161-1354(+)|eukprot:CAMPEP_0168170004 /NCGR_PEP_ID=MMETSP0139_2-20121125/3939_1 /TAXON_ID=44445 /ORGANISM="Pseudo-nitzschia australis, Strain 10249 10 AB" /LENGTH=397 /DNA_ID=CAMNT_0008087459 /DNA_START=88 /DNA_END=1281 /DNA_ORIENTATION=+
MNEELQAVNDDSPVPESPMASVREDEFSLDSMLSTLKPAKKNLISKLNESIRCDGSTSELSFSVNDSAKGLAFGEVYDKEEVLGEGIMAIVYRCVHRESGRSYAVKEVLSENYDTPDQNIKEEIDSLKKLKDGPYIVKLWDVFEGPDETHLIMELMRGGDLLGRLVEKEVFSERDSRRIIRKLMEAIFFCHKKHIVHRDIKLDNILVDVDDDTKIKLADFGCAHPFIPGEKSLKTICGSPQYAAPELYMNEDGYDEKCDLWSIGVVVFVLLGGYAPFDGPDAVELRRVICEGYVEFPAKYWDEISEDAKKLINSLLVVDPDERSTLVKALDSEWLRRRDRESIKRHSVKLDGTSSNPFEAWIKLQSESNAFKGLSESTHSGLTYEGPNDDSTSFCGD